MRLTRPSVSISTCNRLVAGGLLTIGLLLAEPAPAGDLSVLGPSGRFTLPVKSMAEQRWNTVVRQQYDFSCGSAALATLLTYHYNMPVREDEVFRDMFTIGDQEKIKQHGFSMLDMKTYLNSRGLQADGFRFKLDSFARIRVPGITLVNTNGYKHFVVVKGISDDEILIGDPAAGTIILSREQFETLWSGAVLVARADVATAQRHFNMEQDWALRPRSPLDGGHGRSDLGHFTLGQPGFNEIGL
jgi:predicted double-glycine peptidase